MTYIIRKIDEKDYSSIAAIIRDDLGYENSSNFDVARRLKNIRNHKDYTTFVAEQNKEIVGFIGLMRGFAYEIDGSYIRVAALAVKKEHQNRGIGNRLLEEAEKFAKKSDARTIMLNSGIQRTNAHDFYERRGYIKKGYSFKKSI